MAKRGALPKYDIHHLVWALFLIAENDKPGRQTLAELMGIGEGTCRGVLKELDEKGLITTTKSGI